MSAKTFLLLVLLFIAGAFAYLKIQAAGSPDSEFNRTTRYRLGQSQFVRSILNLHRAGDAQQWYANGSSALVVEVVQAKGNSVDDRVIADFAEKIGALLHRPVTVYNTEKIPEGALNDESLAKVSSEFRRHVLFGQPNLFVVYAEDLTNSDNQAARTFEEYGIALSAKKISDLTAGQPQALADVQRHLLLHEFGHQLGLIHSDSPVCVMHPQTESLSRPVALNGKYAVLDFCSQELQQLSKLQ